MDELIGMKWSQTRRVLVRSFTALSLPIGARENPRGRSRRKRKKVGASIFSFVFFSQTKLRIAVILLLMACLPNSPRPPLNVLNRISSLICLSHTDALARSMSKKNKGKCPKSLASACTRPFLFPPSATTQYVRCLFVHSSS